MKKPHLSQSTLPSCTVWWILLIIFLSGEQAVGSHFVEGTEKTIRNSSTGAELQTEPVANGTVKSQGDNVRRSRDVYFADGAVDVGRQDNIYHVLEDQDLGYDGNYGDSAYGDTYVQASNDIYTRYNGHYADSVSASSGGGGSGGGWSHRPKRIHHHHVTYVESDVISYQDLIIVLAVLAMGYYFIQVYWALNSTPATTVTFARRNGMQPEWDHLTPDWDPPFMDEDEPRRHQFDDSEEKPTKIRRKSRRAKKPAKRRTEFEDTRPFDQRLPEASSQPPGGRPWFFHDHQGQEMGREIKKI